MYAIKIVSLFIAESCITLELFSYELVFDPVRFLSSATPSTVFHFTIKVFFLSLLLNCFATIHFFVTYWKKNFRQTSKIHLSGLTFFEMPCDGYPWAPAILQKPIWSYWSIRKDSLIDFHVMLKGAELLFFRLKILFNWKIIVVEETETFLSPGN